MLKLLFHKTPEEYEYHHRCFGTAAVTFYAINFLTSNPDHMTVLTNISGFFIAIAWILKLGVHFQGGYSKTIYDKKYNYENNEFD